MVTASGFRPIRFGEGTSPEKSKEAHHTEKKESGNAEQVGTDATPVGLPSKEASPVALLEPLAIDTLDKKTETPSPEAAEKADATEKAAASEALPFPKRSGIPPLEVFAPGGVMHRVLGAVERFFHAVAERLRKLSERFQQIGTNIRLHKHQQAMNESLRDGYRNPNPQDALKLFDVTQEEADKLVDGLRTLKHPEADEIHRYMKSQVEQGKGFVYAEDLKDISQAKAHFSEAHALASQEPPVRSEKELELLANIQKTLESGQLPSRKEHSDLFVAMIDGKPKKVIKTSLRQTDSPEGKDKVMASQPRTPSDKETVAVENEAETPVSKKARVEDALPGA